MSDIKQTLGRHHLDRVCACFEIIIVEVIPPMVRIISLQAAAAARI
jgi:hypothetical protein